MRCLLISVAALALTAGTAFAQPDQEHGHGHRPEQSAPQHAGPPAGAPQAQVHAQPQPQPQRAAPHGGPTSFTNQMTGHPPDQGQGHREFDRGNHQQAQQQPAQPQVAAPQQGRDRDRGNFQGRPNSSAGFNRPNNTGNRPNNNGFGNNGFANPNNNRFAGRPNTSRHDWHSYNNYHRDYRPTRRFHASGYRRPPGWYAHSWTFGEFLPSLFWGRDYWLDYRLYDLPPPPYGATWVRVGDDALLIDEDSGEIITVAYGVFY